MEEPKIDGLYFVKVKLCCCMYWYACCARKLIFLKFEMRMENVWWIKIDQSGFDMIFDVMMKRSQRTSKVGCKAHAHTHASHKVQTALPAAYRSCMIPLLFCLLFLSATKYKKNQASAGGRVIKLIRCMLYCVGGSQWSDLQELIINSLPCMKIHREKHGKSIVANVCNASHAWSQHWLANVQRIYLFSFFIPLATRKSGRTAMVFLFTRQITEIPHRLQ